METILPHIQNTSLQAQSDKILLNSYNLIHEVIEHKNISLSYFA